MGLRREPGEAFILQFSYNSFTDRLLVWFLYFPLFSFLISSPFISSYSFPLLEDGNKYVISCVVQHEAGACRRYFNILGESPKQTEKFGKSNQISCRSFMSRLGNV